MRRRALLTGLVASPLIARAATPLRAVATFSVLGDMLRQIGGDTVRVITLVPPDVDVHTYQPRPADLRGVVESMLLVENGMGLEGWLQRLTGAAEFHGALVVATAGITPRTLREGSAISVDPHAWQDPRNGLIYARNIASSLAKIDPARAAEHSLAGERYAAEIARVDVWIGQQFASIPRERRRIITTHDAFGYYAARYDVEFLAPEGLSTDAEPSARAIAALVAQIRREKIRAVFIENMTDPRTARMLARETGAAIGGTVYSDALSPPDGPAATYLSMLRHNTTLFTQTLR